MTLKSMMNKECFFVKLYLRGKLALFSSLSVSLKARVALSWNCTFSSLRSQHKLNSVPLSFRVVASVEITKSNEEVGGK